MEIKALHQSPVWRLMQGTVREATVQRCDGTLWSSCKTVQCGTGFSVLQWNTWCVVFLTSLSEGRCLVCQMLTLKKPCLPPAEPFYCMQVNYDEALQLQKLPVGLSQSACSSEVHLSVHVLYHIFDFVLCPQKPGRLLVALCPPGRVSRKAFRTVSAVGFFTFMNQIQSNINSDLQYLN